MRRFFVLFCFILSFGLGIDGALGQENVGTARRGRPAILPGHPLTWDATTKKYSATITETNHEFIFSVTNRGEVPVTITAVNPSCGCTVAKLPKSPWLLKRGESGDVSAVVNFNEKTGTFSKLLTVESSAGSQTLTMEMTVPVTEASMHREQNRDASRTNRQAVFTADCAKCHVAPSMGKSGEELFHTACGICHESPHRASMVPDLGDLNKRTYPAYWKFWITNGGKGLMPSFAQDKGGILTEAQIDSLVPYLVQKFPSPTVIKPFSAK